MATMREIRRERTWQPEVVDATESAGIKVAQIIYYVLGIFELLLAFRFAFRLFSANAGNGFVSFIYSVTEPLVAPFRGIFATPAEAGAVLDTAALLAMVIYAIVAYIIARLFYVATEPADSTAVRDDF